MKKLFQDFRKFLADFLGYIFDFSVDAQSRRVFVSAAAEFCGNRAHVNFVFRAESASAGKLAVLPDKKHRLNAVNGKQKRVERVAVTAFLSELSCVFH